MQISLISDQELNHESKLHEFLQTFGHLHYLEHFKVKLLKMPVQGG